MKKCLFVFFVVSSILSAQSILSQVDSLISNGAFSVASKLIDSQFLNRDEKEKADLIFRKDLMNRILIDFNKSENDVKKFIKKYIPDFSNEDFLFWKNNKQVEFINIDGEDKYFHSAARNFFRINSEAQKIFAQKNNLGKDGLSTFLENYIPQVMIELQKINSKVSTGKTIKLHYKIAVPPNTVPEFEIIRCWLPFPKEIPQRQYDVSLISINAKNYVLSDNSLPHRAIYIEQETVKDKETVFDLVVEYQSADYKVSINQNTYEEYDIASEVYKNFTREENPHILFTEDIRKLSSKIICDEINPIKKAKLIYKWINDSIPWASAREYSTIKNIPDYCIENKHGDCGIQSLLFITLCRYNGIPAKWQSGWMLHPGEVNLHDWAEIYFEGIGWIPVDQSFGLQDLKDEDQKWFFFGGLDRYHLIVNNDIGKAFFPAKIFPRSETVDFQRGELEWRGGNLYFDKWDYHMDVEYE